jgi:hypothetical protein
LAEELYGMPCSSTGIEAFALFGQNLRMMLSAGTESEKAESENPPEQRPRLEFNEDWLEFRGNWLELDFNVHIARMPKEEKSTN